MSNLRHHRLIVGLTSVLVAVALLSVGAYLAFSGESTPATATAAAAPTTPSTTPPAEGDSTSSAPAATAAASSTSPAPPALDTPSGASESTSPSDPVSGPAASSAGPAALPAGSASVGSPSSGSPRIPLPDIRPELPAAEIVSFGVLPVEIRCGASPLVPIVLGWRTEHALTVTVGRVDGTATPVGATGVLERQVLCDGSTTTWTLRATGVVGPTVTRTVTVRTRLA